MEDIVTKNRVLGALLVSCRFNPVDIAAHSGVPVEDVERIASPYWRETGRLDRTHELDPDKRADVIEFLRESNAAPEVRQYHRETSPWNPEGVKRSIRLFGLHLDKAERSGAVKEDDLSECDGRRSLALAGLIDSEEVYGADEPGLADLKAEFDRQVERYEALRSAQIVSKYKVLHGAFVLHSFSLPQLVSHSGLPAETVQAVVGDYLIQYVSPYGSSSSNPNKLTIRPERVREVERFLERCESYPLVQDWIREKNPWERRYKSLSLLVKTVERETDGVETPDPQRPVDTSTLLGQFNHVARAIEYCKGLYGADASGLADLSERVETQRGRLQTLGLIVG